MSNGTLHNGRTVAEVLNEFKEELKEFVGTRGQMLRSEMQEKVGAWKTALPTIADRAPSSSAGRQQHGGLRQGRYLCPCSLRSSSAWCCSSVCFSSIS